MTRDQLAEYAALLERSLADQLEENEQLEAAIEGLVVTLRRVRKERASFRCQLWRVRRQRERLRRQVQTPAPATLPKLESTPLAPAAPPSPVPPSPADSRRARIAALRRASHQQVLDAIARQGAAS